MNVSAARIREASTPGRVGHYFQARGIPMDIRRPRLGDPLPETVAMHAGAVIFGGSMSEFMPLAHRIFLGLLGRNDFRTTQRQFPELRQRLGRPYQPFHTG